MSGSVSLNHKKRIGSVQRATTESLIIRSIVIGIVLVFFALFLLLPLAIVFQEAFSKGFATFVKAFEDSATLHSVKLTLFVAAIVVPLNTIFGIAAAWCTTRFQFHGRSLLVALIDLPLWISPVIGGLLYVLVFGAHSLLWPFFQANNIQVIFAVPGILIATLFVTFPYIARNLIPVMQAQGYHEEEAAITLGAKGWQIFWRITLPKIKWGLIYGIILCNARAMGEFGAVSVVSGHIRNKTNTMPLQIEILYNEYDFTSAFAVASILTALALVTLVVKAYAEWKAKRQFRQVK